MPVAHYHLRAKPIGKSGTANAVAAAAYRSGGRGVVASAAYRAAERLKEDGGRVYDFTNKKGVEDAFILVPEGAPIWAEERGKLWNAAEAFETRANGRVATELEISLPKELNAEQRRELIVGFVLALVDRYKVAADVALHVGSDPRNLHAHVQLTHREIGPAGFGDIAGRHTVMRKGKEIPVAGFVATPRDVIKLRKLWENDVNAAYRKAGLDLTVDSRSYQEQGLDIRPQLYLGPERKDNPEQEQKRQERADYNKRIMAQRAERERACLDAAHDQRHEQPRQALRQAQEGPQDSAQDTQKAAPETIAQLSPDPQPAGSQRMRDERAAPDPRLITDRAELKRLQREAGYSSRLGIVRDLVPGFRDLEARRKELLAELREAKTKRQELGRDRDDALKTKRDYHRGLGWWTRKLTQWKIVIDDNIPALRKDITEAEAKLAAHLEFETALQTQFTVVDAAMKMVLDRARPVVAAYERIGEIARRRLREHYEAEHETGRKPRLAQWQEKERAMDETKPPLYERYKAERDTAYAERQAAENAVYARFAAFEQEQRSFYAQHIEQERYALLPAHARYQAIEILKAMRAGDRVQVGMMRDQELFAARSAHPLLDWDSWTQREAERGDPEAARAVERRQAREREGGLER